MSHLKLRNLLRKMGWRSEVVDLRTLVPLDIDAVLESVKKTGRVIILHEAPKTGGFGAEVAALICEKAIEYLKGPIIRVAGYDTPFPYTLEDRYLPNAERVLKAVNKIMQY